MISSTDPNNVRSLIVGAPLVLELVGGLGDAILRMYFSGDAWYGPLERLPPRDYAVVVLMCHNPYLAEVFQWHPNYHRIHVIDLGFTTPFHPWENPGWRFDHGLPKEAPCPPYMPAETLKFYPSPEDSKILAELRTKKYIIMCASAGTKEKTIPAHPREVMAAAAVEAGYEVVIVGRSKYFFGERKEDVLPRPGVTNLIDRLSVPGVAEAVKTAAGVISADTSVLHMAWQEQRPVFLLYNRWTLDNMIPRGPTGYMQGINRYDTDHMEFAAFNQDRFRKWIGARG
jgi:Glycosyltransferase family 9 (heptosyltransferase)